MKKILTIKNLRKIYHTKNAEILAVDDFSFDLYEGEFVSIVGPSGCGKSTVLSILSGLLDKSEGQIKYNDNIKFGYMLQNDSLFPFRNIVDNCMLGLEISKEKLWKTKNMLLIKYIWFKRIYPQFSGKFIRWNAPKMCPY